MSGAPHVEKIKIFGERNTGTTFVDDLIGRNFDVDFYRNTLSNPERSARRELTERLAELSWLERMIARDRFESMAHPRMIETDFGWKHTCPPVELLRSQPERAAQTLFVVTVKHPVFWALSLHKRSYHIFIRSKAMEFSDFIRHVCITSGRDCLPEPVYDSVIDLYAAKVDGYRALAGLDVPFVLVRYEDLLRDIPGFLKRLEHEFGLVRRTKRDLVRQQTTKPEGDKTLADYREKYRLENARTLVSRRDFDFIMSKFGPERLAWLGYPAA